MRIIYAFADSQQEWNCSQWRSLSPADVINRSGKHTAKLLHLQSFCNFESLAVQDIVGSGDVIIVQRNLIAPEVWNAIDYWKGLGKTVIADLDDDYPNLPWSNPAHEFWLKNEGKLGEPPIELLTKGMRHCDALSSPSKVILEDWKDVVPGIWIPNYAQADWWLNVRSEKRKSEDIVIGWGGSVSHYDSWWFSGIIPAVETLCKENSRVKVKICGNDKRILDHLNIPQEQKIYQAGVSPSEWVKIVGTFDIGVAPLDMRDGSKSYDNHRSWIKGLEYMLACVPWIGSRSDVYKELAPYGTVVENTIAEWENALRATIANIDQAKRFARKKRHIAWELTLEKNVENIVGAYENIKQRTIRDLPNVWYVNWEVESGILRERRTSTQKALQEAESKIVASAAKLPQEQVYQRIQQWAGRTRFGGAMVYELLGKMNQ